MLNVYVVRLCRVSLEFFFLVLRRWGEKELTSCLSASQCCHRRRCVLILTATARVAACFSAISTRLKELLFLGGLHCPMIISRVTA